MAEIAWEQHAGKRVQWEKPEEHSHGQVGQRRPGKKPEKEGPEGEMRKTMVGGRQEMDPGEGGVPRRNNGHQ